MPANMLTSNFRSYWARRVRKLRSSRRRSVRSPPGRTQTCRGTPVSDSRRELLLAFRAPERRPPVLGEAPDDAAAARRSARLAFAVVDLKRMLEIAELTRGLAMIPQG